MLFGMTIVRSGRAPSSHREERDSDCDSVSAFDIRGSGVSHGQPPSPGWDCLFPVGPGAPGTRPVAVAEIGKE